MKNIVEFIKKELVFKIDFVKNEYEIGFIWFGIIVIKCIAFALHLFVQNYCS